MKIYLIQHIYETDGGFGDAIPSEEILGCFFDKAQAEEYVAKWGQTLYVYAKPYDYLTYGQLFVKEMNLDSLFLDIDPFKGTYFEEQRAEYLATKKEDDPEIFRYEDDDDWD